mgnify:CR=1 FL=1
MQQQDPGPVVMVALLALTALAIVGILAFAWTRAKKPVNGGRVWRGAGLVLAGVVGWLAVLAAIGVWRERAAHFDATNQQEPPTPAQSSADGPPVSGASTGPPAPASGSNEDLLGKVSIEQLFRERRANEFAFDAKYGARPENVFGITLQRQWVETTAYVWSVSRGIRGHEGEPSLHLSSKKPTLTRDGLDIVDSLGVWIGPDLYAFFDSPRPLEVLRPGDRVTLRCHVREGAFPVNLFLSACRVLSVEPRAAPAAARPAK